MKSPEKMTLEELEQLKNRIDAVEAAFEEKQRNALTHAKCFIGGMVLSRFAKDWKSVNFEQLQIFIEQHASEISQMTCDELPLEEAKKRLRNFEVGHNAWNSYGQDPETAENINREQLGPTVDECQNMTPEEQAAVNNQANIYIEKMYEKLGL